MDNDLQQEEQSQMIKAFQDNLGAQNDRPIIVEPVFIEEVQKVEEVKKFEAVEEIQEVASEESKIISRDTSFVSYKSETKQRSIWMKSLMLILKIILFLMLLPLIGPVLVVVLGLVIGIVTIIGSGFFAGIMILGSTCFVSTQLSGSIVLALVLLSIAILSLSTIFTLLTIMFTRGLIGLVKKLNVRRKNKGGQ